MTEEKLKLMMQYTFHNAVSKAYYTLYCGQPQPSPFIITNVGEWAEWLEPLVILAGDAIVRELGPTLPFTFERTENEWWVGYTIIPPPISGEPSPDLHEVWGPAQP